MKEQTKNEIIDGLCFAYCLIFLIGMMFISLFIMVLFLKMLEFFNGAELVKTFNSYFFQTPISIVLFSFIVYTTRWADKSFRHFLRWSWGCEGAL